MTSAVPGILRFWYAPTLLWIDPSNRMLMAICWVGLIASVILVFNVWPRGMLLVCFVCYLSFVARRRIFPVTNRMECFSKRVSFRYFSHRRILAGVRAKQCSLAGEHVFAAMGMVPHLFRIGRGKNSSGDPTWRNFTAMDNYYQNGPLPTWIGWYVQHFPHWFHAGDRCAHASRIELVLVWMLFLPRRFRIVCFCIVTPFQLGIILTANYAFLNYLVLSLGFLLLDDRFD